MLKSLYRAIALRCEKTLKKVITGLNLNQVMPENAVFCDAYMQGCLKTIIPCSLQKFSVVSMIVRGLIGSTDVLQFYPSFSETQFHSGDVTLKFLQQLCDHLQRNCTSNTCFHGRKQILLIHYVRTGAGVNYQSI